MTPRSIIVLTATSVAAVAVAGAAFVGATAPGIASVPIQTRAAAAPSTTLHLPTTLHLVLQIVGEVKPTKYHQIYTDGVRKRGSQKLSGAAALSCSGVSGSAPKEECNGAISFSDGVLVISDVLDINTGTITGQVLAGTGSLGGAQGTIKGQNKGGGASDLTVEYSLG